MRRFTFQWGALLVLLSAAVTQAEDHAEEHQSASLESSDQSLTELEESAFGNYGDRGFRERWKAQHSLESDLGMVQQDTAQAPNRPSVQEFLDPGGGTMTVGVMPAREVGESAHTETKSSQGKNETAANAKAKAQQRHKGALKSVNDSKEKVEKHEAKTNAEKQKATAAKNKLQKRHEDSKAKKQLEAAAEKSKQEQHQKSQQVEKDVKKADHVLKMERQGAQASEVKHKEAEQVHKNFINKEMGEKEDREKRRERAKKAEILDLTQELNDKAETKKQSLMGEPGGAMVASGTFKLTSAYLAGKEAEKRAKIDAAKKKEREQKEEARLKERKKKQEVTAKRVRIADAAEKIEKDKEQAEANEKQIFAAKQREKREKERLGEQSTKELTKKAKEKVSKLAKRNSTNSTSQNQAELPDGMSNEGSNSEGPNSLERDLASAWGNLAEGWKSKRNTFDFTLLQFEDDPHDKDQRRAPVTLGEASRDKPDGTDSKQTAKDQVSVALNQSAAERDSAREALAREKGNKQALEEQDEARAKADKTVEEAQTKELKAKKSVEKAKKVVVKKTADDARKMVDDNAEISNSTLNSSNSSNSSSNSSWGIPEKPWNGYTDEDLRKMLKKAKMKENYLCKAAELLPNLANKAKAAADQAYVESRKKQVKRVAKLSKFDEVETSKYQERKTKSYSQLKEVYSKADDRAQRATGECDDARRDRDTLRRKIAEAKTTGFVKAKLPKPSYSFESSEIKLYPNCRKIFAKRDFQQWLALKSDRDLEMAKKEHSCRIRKLEREQVRINALHTAVEAATGSLKQIKGASRCVMQPAIKRMFSMLEGEDASITPSIKNFVKAVELQRKMVDTAENVTKVEMLYSNSLGDPLGFLGEDRKFEDNEIAMGRGDYSEDSQAQNAMGEDLGSWPDDVDSQDDLGESAGVEAKSTSPLDRVELGAILDDFEKKEVGSYNKKVEERKKKNKVAKELLDEKTLELKEKQKVALDKEQAAKNEKRMKSSEKTAKKAPEAKYTCLYEEFENALGPSAKKLTMKYKLSKHTVSSQLDKLKGLLDKAEQEEKSAAEDGPKTQLGAAINIKTSPAAQTFTVSQNFNLPVRRNMESTDLGESNQLTKGGEELPGCAAFYATHSPKKAKKKRAKKPKAELPPPPGEELGESLQPGTQTGRKLLQGRAAAAQGAPDEPPAPTKARNPRDLRMKITAYVMRMTRRASRLADRLLDDVKKSLDKAIAEAGALKVKIKNAHNLVKVERLKIGSEESLQQGRCVGNTCFKGIMFKAVDEGDEVTWICRRGLSGKKDVRQAFSCSMTTQNGKMHMCVGKEIWFGMFWVPFIKELRCPKEIDQSCTENRQCGSEGLPLTKPYSQRRLRNECAQL